MAPVGGGGCRGERSSDRFAVMMTPRKDATMHINPSGCSGTKGECGMAAPVEDRFMSPAGLDARFMTASGAERFIP